MAKSIIIISFFVFLISCTANRKTSKVKSIPLCLQTKIKKMAEDPKEGSPISVAQYTYKNQTVYYMVSPCCDKFNVVYDSACNILGYPDGGFTGKGDGRMNDFKKEAINEKLVWKKE